MSPSSHSHSAEPSPGAVSEEEMMKHKLDIALRDSCAHLLIPLNECRKGTFSLPFLCEHERHIYEKCQYLDWKQRCQLMKEKKMAAKA